MARMGPAAVVTAVVVMMQAPWEWANVGVWQRSRYHPTACMGSFGGEESSRMRTRTRLLLTSMTVAAAVVAGVAVYRARTAGYAEVREITERVAAAMAAGDQAALAADPALQGHPGTADWLAAHGPALGSGYRVTVQRNGANGYRLMELNVVSHVGLIETPAGNVSLGFWRDPDGGGLTFVTAAASTMPAAASGPDGPEIRVGRE